MSIAFHPVKPLQFRVLASSFTVTKTILTVPLNIIFIEFQSTCSFHNTCFAVDLLRRILLKNPFISQILEETEQ